MVEQLRTQLQESRYVLAYFMHIGERKTLCIESRVQRMGVHPFVMLCAAEN